MAKQSRAKQSKAKQLHNLRGWQGGVVVGRVGCGDVGGNGSEGAALSCGRGALSEETTDPCAWRAANGRPVTRKS